MKLLRLLLLIIFCLCFGPQAIPGSIKDIKGTWDILLPEHRLALSPALGALAIESHYIKKLYYFGNPNHATTQLVKVIFHAFNGGFQPSKHNMPTPLCSIKTIAKILTTISQNYGLPVDLLKEQLIKTLLSDEDFNTEFMNKNNGLTFSQAQEEYNIYQKELSRTEKLAQHYNNIKERANNYLRSKQLVTRGIGDDFELIAKLETILSTKENPSTEEKSTEKAKKRKRIDLPNVAELRKVFDAKNRRTQLSSLLAKNPFNSIINFADLIARSCNECQSQSPSSSSSRSSSSSSSSSSSVATNQNYEGYATEHILLALLYKKSLTRQDFATYFQELPKEFLALKATDDWVNDSYEPNAHKKFEKLLQKS